MAKKTDKKLEVLNEKIEEIRKNAQEWEKDAEKKIKEHPVQSVLISFGAGILAGALLTTLMRRK